MDQNKGYTIIDTHGLKLYSANCTRYNVRLTIGGTVTITFHFRMMTVQNNLLWVIPAKSTQQQCHTTQLELTLIRSASRIFIQNLIQN